MDKDTAKQLMARAKDCIHLFNEMVELAQSHCDQGEERVVRRAVGFALSELLDRLMVPIFREYPDLIPEGTDYGSLEGPTFTELASETESTGPFDEEEH